MKNCAVFFVLLLGAAVHGGTFTHNFSKGLGDKFILEIDYNYWSTTVGDAGLTIKRTDISSLAANGWTMSFDIAKFTKTGSHDLSGDFSVTVCYTGYTGWKPTYEQQNRFYIINALWGYLGGEYAYIGRNAENNWWTVPWYYPDAASRMFASVEGGGPFQDWGMARTSGVVTLSRSGNVFTMTADGVVICSATGEKLAARPLALDIWMSASFGGFTDMPEVTIESITVTADDVCSGYDISNDCGVDMADYSMLAAQWLDGCDSVNQWCDGIDYDYSGQVGTSDLLKMASDWLK